MPLSEIILNQSTYPIIPKRRKGCRRFVLRFDTKKQCVTISLPMRASIRDALAFAHSKKVWLELQEEKRDAHICLKPGDTIPVLGHKILLKHEQGRGVATLDDARCGDMPTLTIHGDAEFFSRRLKDWLKKTLKQEIEALAERTAKQLGVDYKRIQIRDVVHQWGSCSAAGNLSFAFQLVFAEPEIVHYLVCHEVAHLKEMNHGKKFWKLVQTLCPDYETHRRWLKRHGGELQRYEL